jgi:thiosulfate/3-mercaptopyruvate sulfurtransferase
MTGGGDGDARTAALLLRVWSEPGSPQLLRARLVDADGATVSTAAGDAEIGREVLRWLARLRPGAAPPPPRPAPAGPAAPPLVTAGWVAEHAADPDVVVLQVGDRRDRPETGFLPDAGWLDWIEDLQQPDRRGLVDPAGFAAVMDRLGVGPGSHVVLAGGRRPTVAASAYWCLRYHGHRRLSLLDGGLRRWTAEGRQLVAFPTEPRPTAGYRPAGVRRDLLVTRDQLLGGLAGAPPGTALVDCRSRAEFAGRPLRPYDRPTDRHRMTGRIPGARNLPSEDLLDPDGRLLEPARLDGIARGAGLDPADQVVVYCGTADRSTLVWFALHEVLGWPDVACYYGSWSEYGSLTEVPVERP